MIREYLNNEYFKKRDLAVKEIQEKFDIYYSDNHNDLKNLIEFINYTDSYIKSLLDKIELIEHVDINLHKNLEEIRGIINNYRIDQGFNDEKARKWFVNALIMVIVNGYEFQPPYFVKGDQKILKTDILK